MTHKDIGLHRVHEESGIDEFDVFIAGSGPIGATYARLLVDAGYNVVMAEIGDQQSRIPGAHKKNEIEFQKDIDRFVKVIQGALSTVSVPVSKSIIPTLDPSAWTAENPNEATITNGRNPKQEEHNNLGAEAVTRCVGGMSTHWTCATPRFLKGLERPEFFEDEKTDDQEWDLLYQAAEALIGTSEEEFDESIRHNVVLNALKKAYPDRGVKPLPLACHRITEGSPYVMWHSAENVFGDIFINPSKENREKVKRGYFKLLTNTCCTQLKLYGLGPITAPYKIEYIEVKDLLEDRGLTDSSIPSDFYIKAKVYVIAAGAVATPQILAKSGFGGKRPDLKTSSIIPNLGGRITEQPMTFCQIILDRALVEDIGENLDEKPYWWQAAVLKHQKNFPKDPLPIPFKDPEPQVTIPASIERPWHTQIHRDAFSYGEVGPLADSRVVVDLRFFGMQSGVDENKMYFEDTITDAYGMPQPTFVYAPTGVHIQQAHSMMNDMTNVASELGGYLPGSYPQFMTPGLALHLGGTVSTGNWSEKNKTVANYNSQVWDFTNLYVAGNGVISTPFAANPTLTSICFAIRSAYKISEDLRNNQFPPPISDSDNDIQPTPPSWVNWATDKTDPNYPNHKDLRRLHRSV